MVSYISSDKINELELVSGRKLQKEVFLQKDQLFLLNKNQAEFHKDSTYINYISKLIQTQN